MDFSFKTQVVKNKKHPPTNCQITLKSDKAFTNTQLEHPQGIYRNHRPIQLLNLNITYDLHYVHIMLDNTTPADEACFLTIADMSGRWVMGYYALRCHSTEC